MRNIKELTNEQLEAEYQRALYTRDTSLSNILVLLTFLVLKMAGVISWSWWWALSPLWVPVAVFILVLLVTAAVKAWG